MYLQKIFETLAFCFTCHIELSSRLLTHIVVNKLKRSDTTIVTIPPSDGDRVVTFVCSIVHAVTKIDAKSIQ